ncbi:hypothetical protein UPYG_G00156490 [Umbra pygmaea]|uniref:Ig-like domain-containing protein n=1 Tax=Umbra pygmaea TaxID=75934 RepID=A0ABD0XED8_UMBPY
MKVSVVILILSETICTLAQVEHEVIAAIGCFDSGETQVVLMVDGDEFIYANFEQKEAKQVLPVSLSLAQSPSIQYEYAELSKMLCKEKLDWGKASEPIIPHDKEAPDSTIYTRNEVELGINNMLICSVNNFFPPLIKVNWTKNAIDVTEGATLSRYYPNTDGTFYQFSILSFTPQQGEFYTCTVEHTALEEPKIRTWEPVVSESRMGPVVFCGLGLTLGGKNAESHLQLCPAIQQYEKRKLKTKTEARWLYRSCQRVCRCSSVYPGTTEQSGSQIVHQDICTNGMAGVLGH